MEILRVCGIEADLRRLELPIDPGAEWRHALTGPPIREDVPGVAVADEISPCEGLAISQDVFEAVLRKHASGYGVAQVRAGVELESLEVSGEGADAGLLDHATGVRSRVRARYVIAADGARSPIRQRLGIPDLPLEVLASARWTAAAQTAYAMGPVFLTGDAAHRFPPAGATGVSAAMHDVHNLAWKLALVLTGRAPAALLGTYADERRRSDGGPPRRGARPGRGYGIARAPPSPGAACDSSTWATSTNQPLFPLTAVRTPTGREQTTPDRNARMSGATPMDQHRPGHRSTVDLFDQDFVLLTAPPAIEWRTAADAASRTLGILVISHIIAEPEWPHRYRVTPAGAVLVRPDGHVAWRRGALPTATEAPAETQMIEALATATGAHTASVR